MDPNCGVKTWYLKPTFYFQILWAVFSFVIIIYNIVLLSKTTDGFFNRAVSSGPSTIAVFILIFVILSVVGNCLSIFRLFRKYKKLILYGSCVTSAFTMILAIIYASVYGNQSYEKDTADKEIIRYMYKYPNNPETINFKKHITGKEVDAIYNYNDARLTHAGKILLGLLITWFLQQCCLLFIFIQDDEYAEVGNSQPLTANDGLAETYSK
ncbi:hypothetical protein TVAG_071720 [Trichomonas vaginalis G3]|uniref:Tetraspanin family protein n=1 Tax=Trichomonas vaginalis (strain ATCC PRA-98 / G3) TaxID=412133 RepID=A2D875_TRIV3|nr:hypothetical protein TVAGG3_1046820 [Trichomonas vaginalis G3]EAY23508.1 hypothetical protein TVAG_071720 [Trichomonas vaginalis G3]KAI5493930.1 hypothetical protein TVAGG3_1046820 [Trichomonas vaginalis G3]|eukprot:XP_001584494.1 hypothetical protein [Trichomonas vaginalis G3]